MINWYPIITITDFKKNDTPSMDISIETAEYGILEIRIVKSNFYALVYNDIYLPIELNEQNPYQRDNLKAYSDGNTLWIGFIEADETKGAA